MVSWIAKSTKLSFVLFLDITKKVAKMKRLVLLMGTLIQTQWRSKKILLQVNHCYQVNDCSSKVLVIKGGAYFLSHCQPFLSYIPFGTKSQHTEIILVDMFLLPVTFCEANSEFLTGTFDHHFMKAAT